MSRSVRTIREQVIVTPVARKTGIDLGDGRTLHLGREVERPFGYVIAVGSECSGELKRGDLVMWLRDLGAEYDFEFQDDDGTWCTRKIASLPEDEVLLVVESGGTLNIEQHEEDGELVTVIRQRFAPKVSRSLAVEGGSGGVVLHG